MIFPSLRRFWLLLTWEWLGAPRRLEATWEARMRLREPKPVAWSTERRVRARWEAASR